MTEDEVLFLVLMILFMLSLSGLILLVVYYANQSNSYDDYVNKCDRAVKKRNTTKKLRKTK